jgi:hypothetical protein
VRFPIGFGGFIETVDAANVRCVNAFPCAFASAATARSLRDYDCVHFVDAYDASANAAFIFLLGRCVEIVNDSEHLIGSFRSLCIEVYTLREQMQQAMALNIAGLCRMGAG